MANTDLQNLADEIRQLRQFIELNWQNRAVTGAQVIVVTGLSDISEQLGTVTAGEFRTGVGDPGKGFTGGRFGYPGFLYGSTTYFLAGVANDVLQVGMSLTDGKVYAGAGAVVLDSSGQTVEADGTNYIIFHDSTEDEDVGYITGLEASGYHRMDFFALVPVGSDEEAHVRFVASNFASGLEATFDLFTDAPAQVDLRGLATANQKLIFYAGLQMEDGYNVSFGTTIGTQIGTASDQLLSFWGVAPITQPAALTAAITQITHTEPATPDYSIQTGTAGGLWGFVTQNEMRTLLKVVKNLQVRLDEWETAAVAEGLIDASGGGGGGGGGGTPGNTGAKTATAVETSSPTWTGWTAANLNTVDNSFASYGPTDSASGWHILKNFAFGVPGGATPVGIWVQPYGVASGHFASSEVRLSWDGGTSWTSVKTFTPNGNPQWFSLGGPADLWGHVWTDTELSDANFRMAVRRTDDTPTPPFSWTNNTTYIDKSYAIVYYTI